VILEWEQPTTGVTRLSLERKGGANTDFVTVMEKLPANEIGYIDNVQPETAYTYRLFAWAGEVRSNEPAGPVTVTTPPYPPAPPAWIKAEAQGPRRVAISWGEAPRAKKFTLLRADEKTGEFLSIATLENKQIYTDDEVAPETRYWYKVRAANENPETTESKVVSVVTPREGAAASAREAAAEEIAPTPRPRPLAQPTIVEAVVDVDGVLLRWEQAARNASYAVMRTYDLGVPFVTLDVVDGVTNFIDRRVSPGRSYYYKIRAYAPDGRTAESEIVRVDLDVPGSSPVVIGAPPELPPPPVIGGVVIDVSIAPLEPPRRLEVRQPAPDRVELRWHGAQGADRFYILRSERGSRWFDIIDRVDDRKSYVDRDILPDTQYWYRVRAANRWGMVADSEVVSIRTQAAPSATPTPAPPAAPRSVEARALGPTEIELRWGDAPGATAFVVLRAEARQGEYYPIERVRDRWSYVDRGLQPNKTYWYKIRATNDGPTYAESSPVSAKTPAAATPTPSPTASPSPTAGPSPSPSPTATPVPTVSPSPSPSPTVEPSPSPTATPEPTPTATPRPTPPRPPHPTPTATPEPVPTATPPEPTVTPEPTATPAPSPTPTPAPSPTPTLPPRPPHPTPTATPEPVPTATPPEPTVTPEPTATPTRTPRPRPTRPPRIETPSPTLVPETPEPVPPTPGATVEEKPAEKAEQTPRRVFPTRGPFLTPRPDQRRPRVPWATATPVPGKGLPTVRERTTREQQPNVETVIPSGGKHSETEGRSRDQVMEQTPQALQRDEPRSDAAMPESRRREGRPPSVDRAATFQRIRQQVRPIRATSTPAGPAEAGQSAPAAPSDAPQAPAQP
jgi:fibronectin type 3 domain-containing protein